ncbi:hypothetical protein [Streptomyces sp. NPDC056361]|uniref:hypothetical protein n=1 Tax=Streptomyces sp. NPDC056361 TaxID=3345795 RepID=UPI0035DD45E1
MSTTRRPLGTGPTTSTSSATLMSPPRLLPVERADGGVLLVGVDEHQEHADAKGRRLPGAGPAGL